MNYTKGEWRLEGDGVIASSDGKQIASVFPRDREANSRLIVAAPAMYEALIQWLVYLDTTYPRNMIEKKHAYNLMEKALAKVEASHEHN